MNGNIRAKKVDADTGKALSNAKLKFEYDGKTKEITTGADGSAALDDIKFGTKDFSYNQIVSLVNPVIDTIATADFRGVATSWYLKAIILHLQTKKERYQKK